MQTFDYTNLKNYMLDKGINERFLSVMTGISEESLRKKIDGQTKFATGEVQSMISLFSTLFEDFTIGLSDHLFFEHKAA